MANNGNGAGKVHAGGYRRDYDDDDDDKDCDYDDPIADPDWDPRTSTPASDQTDCNSSGSLDNNSGFVVTTIQRAANFTDFAKNEATEAREQWIRTVSLSRST